MGWEMDEAQAMSQLTHDTRNELIAEAQAKAKALGANAITGLRLETNPICDGTVDIVLYGTAVHVTR